MKITYRKETGISPLSNGEVKAYWIDACVEKLTEKKQRQDREVNEIPERKISKQALTRKMFYATKTSLKKF